jgi:hypothetical protein
MDQMLPYVVLAVGGLLGGNVLGALTRGGGGVTGRSILGALGGVALGFAGMENGANVAAIGEVTRYWSALPVGDAAIQGHVANLITGAAGGGVLGLVGGLLIRPRG